VTDNQKRKVGGKGKKCMEGGEQKSGEIVKV
jgi:hypothetical protein